MQDTLCLRLYDVTTGFKNQNNPCDFIVFRNGTLNLFECKAIHGKYLNFSSHIRENQWNQLLKFSFLPYVNAGMLVWFIDFDRTFFIPIWDLNYAKIIDNKKSLNISNQQDFANAFEIKGKKKKVFFEYDLEKFLEEISYE